MVETFEAATGARRRLPLVLVVLVVVAVAVVAKLAGPTPGAELTLAQTSPPRTATTAPEPSPATVRPHDRSEGTWDRLPPAPIPGRTRHTATWTGTEMLIFGGQPDPGLAHGARYDPTTRQWHPMAPAPIGSRVGHTAVWTGQELIIFEGAPIGQAAAAAAQDIDGAAYDPESDTWRQIAPAPINPRTGHAAVWTGKEMVVFGGSRTLRFGASVALYDPAADTWRMSSESPLDWAFGLVAAVWTGTKVVIWSGTGPADVAAYDPEADTWELLPGSPVGMRSASALWTGQEMVLLGLPEGDRSAIGGAALDLAEQRWTVLPPSPQVFAATYQAVWTGDQAIVLGGPGQNLGSVWSPGLGRWSELPGAPQSALSGHAAVWTGEEVLLWGGQGEEGTLASGLVFNLSPPGGG